MQIHRKLAGVAFIGLLWACGGSVEQGPAAGAAGTPQGGGSGQGGANGGSGGSGGTSQAGTGGTHTGGSSTGGSSTGGSGAGGCSTLPDCNWCGGTEVLDLNGCPDHYACKNGADPCKTAPCTPQSGCKTGEMCDSKGLCWPVTCDKTGECSVSSAGDCLCGWNCTDGAYYEMDCKPAAGGMQCDCRKDKVSIVGCASSGTSVCSPPGCCPFPM